MAGIVVLLRIPRRIPLHATLTVVGKVFVLLGLPNSYEDEESCPFEESGVSQAVGWGENSLMKQRECMTWSVLRSSVYRRRSMVKCWLGARFKILTNEKIAESARLESTDEPSQFPRFLLGLILTVRIGGTETRFCSSFSIVPPSVVVSEGTTTLPENTRSR